MRISTNTIYEMGSARISDLQVAQTRMQQQLSTGRRILTPADDPVASARVLVVAQSDAMNQQFATNRQNAKSSLTAVEGALAAVTSLLQDAKTLTINAGNGVFSDSDRASLATELRGQFGQLLGLANATDGTGNYLFSGYQTASQPFVQMSGGVQYQGDQGQRMLQVDNARQIALSDTGTAVFESMRTGNGTFLTAAASTNTGSGVISSGSVVAAVTLPVHSYDVTFAVAAGATTYTVTDTTDPSNPVTVLPVSPNPAPTYVSGQAITFDGMQFDVSGSPSNGDKFTVQPSTNQSIFKTLDDLIKLLGTPVNNVSSSAALAAGLSAANLGIDQSLDSVLTSRASVGSRLKEIDSLDSAGEDRSLQYKSTLSELQDLDYTKAISDFTQQQLVLDAAQKSFVKTSGLSLFTYL